MAEPTRFAIFVYDGVEPIDIGATYGVLSMARRIVPEIEIFLVAPRRSVHLENGLTVLADYNLDDCPQADILIISGGPGWEEQCDSPEVIDFIRRFSGSATIASVCTGGLILAKTGLLEGKSATTKRNVTGSETSPLQLMATRHPGVDVIEARVVDNGEIVTGGGVTLAIDTTLHLLSRRFGIKVAAETARIMEYDVAWKATQETLAAYHVTDANTE